MNPQKPNISKLLDSNRLNIPEPSKIESKLDIDENMPNQGLNNFLADTLDDMYKELVTKSKKKDMN